MRKKVLITGSGGLVGSTAARRFLEEDWNVVGVDNNMREHFFGPDGSVNGSIADLLMNPLYAHHRTNIEETARIAIIIDEERPDCIVHCAAQPSHALADEQPRLDFSVNVRGTNGVLDAAREFTPEATFIFLSTIKVYTDELNRLPWFINEEREYDLLHGTAYSMGFSEKLMETHPRGARSLFGAHKMAAETLVQEYGRYFGMRTVSLRPGCITGSRHAGVPAHGFLSHLVKTTVFGGTYKVEGDGFQVRDQLHSDDIAEAIYLIASRDLPERGERYNLGGGKSNKCSIWSALAKVEALTGQRVPIERVPARNADHKSWVTDTSWFTSVYGWRPTRTLDSILQELVEHARRRRDDLHPVH